MNEFSTWIVRAGLASPSQIQGISERAIAAIEKSQSLSLPEDYKDFLRQCGRAAGRFGEDIHIFYPYFLSLNEDFHHAVEEFAISFLPPQNAFFFSAYQGGYFHYFLCEDADKRIYVLNDGDAAPTVAATSFTSFMIDAISLHQDVLSESRDKSWMLAYHEHTRQWPAETKIRDA